MIVSLHTWNCILVDSVIKKTLYEYNVMTFCVFLIPIYKKIGRKIL
jgi:hypothetical protein